MTPLERLCGAAHGGAVDRPPCICPGGMMNGVVEDVMLKTGIYWPKAHCDAQMMADLARALYESGGFENYGVPFCMTVEAEALGAEADMGGCEVEPHVVRPAIASCAEADRLKPFDVTKGRAAAVVDAVRILKLRSAGVPVIGNITGPVSVAGTLVIALTEGIAFLNASAVSLDIMRFASANVPSLGVSNMKVSEM